MFLSQFLIPLIIFVVAYWKILTVVRRQAKVKADRQRITIKSSEPVAGTSGGTTETTNISSSKDAVQRDKGAAKEAAVAGSRERGQVGNQNGPKSLSKAHINVVKTMVYITVCFTLCWMPMYVYLAYKRLAVRLSLHFFSSRHTYYRAEY